MNSQEDESKIEHRFWLVNCGTVIGAVAAFVSGVHQDPNHYHNKVFPGAFWGGVAGLTVVLGETFIDAWSDKSIADEHQS